MSKINQAIELLNKGYVLSTVSEIINGSGQKWIVASLKDRLLQERKITKTKFLETWTIDQWNY